MYPLKCLQKGQEHKKSEVCAGILSGGQDWPPEEGAVG